MSASQCPRCGGGSGHAKLQVAIGNSGFSIYCCDSCFDEIWSDIIRIGKEKGLETMICPRCGSVNLEDLGVDNG